MDTVCNEMHDCTSSAIGLPPNTSALYSDEMYNDDIFGVCERSLRVGTLTTPAAGPEKRRQCRSNVSQERTESTSRTTICAYALTRTCSDIVEACLEYLSLIRLPSQAPVPCRGTSLAKATTCGAQLRSPHSSSCRHPGASASARGRTLDFPGRHSLRPWTA